MGIDDNPPAVLVPWNEIAKNPASDVLCPDFSSLLACVDAEGIKTTAAPSATSNTSTTPTYNGKFGVILPPVIATLLLQSDDDDPAAVCVLVGRAIKEADTKFQQLAFGEAPIPTDAPTPYQEHCQHIMHFLWWAAMEETSFPGAISLFPVQGKGARWAKETIARSIMSASPHSSSGSSNGSPPGLSPDTNAYTALNEGVRNLRDALEIQAKEFEHKRAATRSGFHKFASHVQRMILNASPPDDIVIVDGPSHRDTSSRTEPVDSYTDILKTSTHATAKQFLDHHLNTVHNCQVDIPPSLASSVLSGFLIWSRMDVPGAFSLLSLPPPSARGYRSIQSDEDRAKSELEAGEGRGLSAGAIASATKLLHIAPMDVPEFQDTLFNFISLCVTLFVEDSSLATSLYKFIPHMQQHNLSYRLQQREDHSFLTQLCFLIDRGVQLFLQSCAQVPRRQDLATEFISFQSLQRKLLRGTWTPVTLPPAYTKLLPQATPTPSPPGKRNPIGNVGHVSDSDSKRPRVDQDNTTQVNNPKVNATWKKVYEKQGATKSVIRSVQKLTDKLGTNANSFCLRYHLKGDCVQGCPRPHDALSANDTKTVDTWLRAVAEQHRIPLE
jgi:hypothetical protein